MQTTWRISYQPELDRWLKPYGCGLHSSSSGGRSRSHGRFGEILAQRSHSSPPLGPHCHKPLSFETIHPFLDGNGRIGRLLILAEQAANNTKEQFANSPDLAKELLNAIMDALAAHTTMSKQALESKHVRQGLRDILLDQAGLYEALRDKANVQGSHDAGHEP